MCIAKLKEEDYFFLFMIFFPTLKIFMAGTWKSGDAIRSRVKTREGRESLFPWARKSKV